MTKVLVGLIATLQLGIDGFDRQIARAPEVHPNFAIFDSLPGAGPVLARACWPRSGRRGIVTKPQPICRRSAEFLPLQNAAASPNGFTFDGLVRASSGRHFTNGRDTPSASAIGHTPTVKCSAPAGRTITRPSEPWHSSGYESPFVAGKMRSHTMTPGTWTVSVVAVHR